MEEVEQMLEINALSVARNGTAPWLTSCSLCGPLGVAATDIAADNIMIEHGRLHPVDAMHGTPHGQTP